jgi:hypothetical protein
MCKRTGSIDCTNSETIPPRKKHANAVNMSGLFRQNQILRASLSKGKHPSSQRWCHTPRKRERGHSLFDVEDEVKDVCGKA